MGDDRDRNSHGRYDDRIDPATTLDVFDARDDRARPLTASDVVEELGIARRTAHNKLNALVERGVLETRKVGARGRVWWTPIYDAESGRESGETRRAPADDHRDGTTSSTTASAEREGENDDSTLAPDLDGVLADWRPGRSAGEKREQQQAAGRATLEFLRERGSATATEFREHVEPEHSVPGQSPGTWWKKTAREALQRAREADLVTFKDGVKEWRWRGDSAGEESS